MKTDTQLQKDVMDQLKWEATIHAVEIGVSVKDGVVTLTGTVDNYAKVWAAEHAVKGVFGVRGLIQEIRVSPTGANKLQDNEIALAATKVLEWNSWMQSDNVNVTVDVKNGQVTLSGNVVWNYQRERAEEAVRHLVGVSGVTNWITINPRLPEVKNYEVKNRIEGALRRNAKLLLASQKIQVESLGSKIVLSGSVGSLAERDEAETSAWSAPGVSEVENNLRVTG